MKKTDSTIIIIIALASVLVAYFVGKTLFGDTYTGTATVKTIDKIDSSIVMPSVDIFNKNAINPTVLVNVTGTDTKTTVPGA